MTKLYKTPSGMGGTFTVKVLERVDGEALVRVKMGNPDWDGYTFWTTEDRLTPEPDRDYAVGSAATLRVGR